jgi:hypothetical protein
VAKIGTSYGMFGIGSSSGASSAANTSAGRAAASARQLKDAVRTRPPDTAATATLAG